MFFPKHVRLYRNVCSPLDGATSCVPATTDGIHVRVFVDRLTDAGPTYRLKSTSWSVMQNNLFTDSILCSHLILSWLRVVAWCNAVGYFYCDPLRRLCFCKNMLTVSPSFSFYFLSVPTRSYLFRSIKTIVQFQLYRFSSSFLKNLIRTRSQLHA